MPALIFGVAVGNVLRGVPSTFDDALRPSYSGSFFGLLTPFPLVCGVVSLALCATHGAVVIAMRTTGITVERARVYGKVAALVTGVLFAVAGLWVSLGALGYAVTSVQDVTGPSNPLRKTVVAKSGAWLHNYGAHPWMLIAPVLGFGGLMLAWIGLTGRTWAVALLGSGLAIVGVIANAGLSLVPFLLPSSADPRASLTVWDASSSHLTLWTMLLTTLVFLPIILAYTAWVYRVMAGPVTAQSIGRNPNAY